VNKLQIIRDVMILIIMCSHRGLFFPSSGETELYILQQVKEEKLLAHVILEYGSSFKQKSLTSNLLLLLLLLLLILHFGNQVDSFVTKLEFASSYFHN
jgi:hypothetical protein